MTGRVRSRLDTTRIHGHARPMGVRLTIVAGRKRRLDRNGRNRKSQHQDRNTDHPSPRGLPASVGIPAGIVTVPRIIAPARTRCIIFTRSGMVVPGTVNDRCRIAHAGRRIPSRRRPVAVGSAAGQGSNRRCKEGHRSGRKAQSGARHRHDTHLYYSLTIILMQNWFPVNHLDGNRPVSPRSICQSLLPLSINLPPGMACKHQAWPKSKR